MISTEVCSGADHLENTLRQITQKKGEGLMLYEPRSQYQSGRTDSLLKLKTYSEADVRFLELSPNSRFLICEQKNGMECKVRCDYNIYMSPPERGTIITVKYQGIIQKSQKLKAPQFWRVRSDSFWTLW
eukprot:TRINITY_DN2152_c0_g1_i13.p1 TRINITY_DN2152_c0_g1~~TRINITY_DN2152_c0_g1_i13.p1  ORF type:complete len:129 (-),score=17.36 TRINITY_DN2152_c0_g1_i13:228-614(-)